ncbi:MAG TPA: hypothetical protein DEA96_02955 [Leptospiraceae bacterium]|nr:hypothetical protein [Spirochaetaceae bacterium]HBS03897.1 hypothetical protein [Leptospiraceae bacterium]|tara:strand:+ start:134 stop:1210 length:1077 start_codon:yes stop_codon:yes gene_type:complete
MQAFSKENFRHIYLLTGTAPEYYGTGHTSRAEHIQSALSEYSFHFHSIVSRPEEFWEGEGRTILASIVDSMQTSPGIIILDARDIDPSPLQSLAPVLALDNSHRTARSDKASKAGSIDSADLAKRRNSISMDRTFPCLYYNLLLPGCDLETSVRRYLGPRPVDAPGNSDSFPGPGNAGSSLDIPSTTDVLVYAGSPGFLSKDLLKRMDATLQGASSGYMRIGGTEPEVDIRYRKRMELPEFFRTLASCRIFIGYYGLSLYQAAASGCRVWGFATGHAYHDELIHSWAMQSGAPVLDPRKGKQSHLSGISVIREDLQQWLAGTEGWTLQPGSLSRGGLCLGSALRGLFRASANRSPVRE